MFSPISQIIHLRVAILTPLVVLLVKLSRKGDVGDDNDIESAGSVLGGLADVTTGVVLVLASAGAVVVPRAVGNLDGGLGSGRGRRSA